MHGARIDACGECMRVHVHGGAWVNCTVWHGSPRPGGRVHSCMHAWECMHACTLLSAHAWCTRGGWVGNIAEVQGGSALHMHGVRSSAYMHGVTIL